MKDLNLNKLQLLRKALLLTWSNVRNAGLCCLLIKIRQRTNIWHCLTLWTSKKSRLFWRFFQYSVICHHSKYMWLALIDFNKNRVVCRNCTWFQLSPIKKNPEGNVRCLFSHLTSQKWENKRGIMRGCSWFRRALMWRHVSHARKQE